MKFLITAITTLMFPYVTIGQKGLDKTRINRGIKEVCAGNYQEAENFLNKITWKRDRQKDSVYNHEMYFKYLYLERFLTRYRYINDSTIHTYSDIYRLNLYFKDVQYLHRNFKLLEEKKETFRDICITHDVFRKLERLIATRSEEIVKSKEQEALKREKDRQDYHSTLSIDQIESEENKFKRIAQQRVEEIQKDFVKAGNSLKNSPHLKALQDYVGDSLYIEYIETITLDSTTFSLKIHYSKDGFEPGVYFNQYVYDFIEERLLNIKHRTVRNGLKLYVTAIGSADGQPIGNLKYSKKRRNFGNIPLTETEVNGETVSMSINVGDKITNSELAFARSWNTQEILFKQFGESYKVDKFLLSDFEGQNDKKYQKYRTTGFFIVSNTYSEEIRKQLENLIQEDRETLQKFKIENRVVFSGGEFKFNP